LDGSAINDIKATTRKNAGYKYHALYISLTSEGARDWSRITGSNVGRELSTSIDGEVCCAPRVMQQIDGGRLEIAGNFLKEEAKMIENIIKSGKLPIKCSVTNIYELK
jgi:preprotein translocase subunit SecD